MSVDVSGPVAASHNDPPNVGTPVRPECAYCEQPGCTGTPECYTEWASSPTTWREIAERRPSWNMAPKAVA